MVVPALSVAITMPFLALSLQFHSCPGPFRFNSDAVLGTFPDVSQLFRPFPLGFYVRFLPMVLDYGRLVQLQHLLNA